jgi:hypothetical protein
MTSIFRLIPVWFLLVASCGCSAGSSEADPSPLRVQYTAAAQAWLADMQTCAGQRPLFAELASPAAIDLQEFDLALSLGAPSDVYPAYEIGEEGIHLIVSSQSPVGALSAQQAAAIYSGAVSNWGELSEEGGTIQVWSYPAGEEIQQFLGRAVLSGGAPVSGSSLAIDPEAMRAAVAADPAAIGILPEAWLTGDVRSVLEVGSMPLLVSTAAEATESNLAIITCLQAK